MFMVTAMVITIVTAPSLMPSFTFVRFSCGGTGSWIRVGGIGGFGIEPLVQSHPVQESHVRIEGCFERLISVQILAFNTTNVISISIITYLLVTEPSG